MCLGIGTYACECAADYLSVKFTGHGWGVLWRCGCRGACVAVVHPCRLVGCSRWASDTTVTEVRRGCFVGWFGSAAANVVASARVSCDSPPVSLDSYRSISDFV